MKKSISLLSIMFLAFLGYAQDYSNAIGLRGGSSNGITFKHFVSDQAALEFILTTRFGGYGLFGLYEIHKSIKSVDRLNFYYGAGVHVGSYNGAKDNRWFKGDENHTVIGVDGILGLEYNFSEIPLNISIDYKPAFNLIGHTGLWADEGALSLRYTF